METVEMVVYFIDSVNQVIERRVIDVPSDMRKLIGGYIELAYSYPNGDVLYVDEEGLLKNNPTGFLFAYRQDQPLVGNGVVCGKELEGNFPEGFITLEPETKLEKLRKEVKFFRVLGQ
jgi:hypothetical protein